MPKEMNRKQKFPMPLQMNLEDVPEKEAAYFFPARLTPMFSPISSRRLLLFTLMVPLDRSNNHITFYIGIIAKSSIQDM